MKKSLLEIVQTTLSAMGSDEVDSINETEESIQVAESVKDTYYEFIERLALAKKIDWLHGPLPVTPSGDVLSPTTAEFGSTVREVTYIGYNVAGVGEDASYRELVYYPPDEFLRQHNKAGPNKVAVSVGDALTVYVSNDRMPTSYTSFDDTNIICNAFDSSIESTLTDGRFNAMGYRIPTFVVADEEVPDLPPQLFPAFQAEVNIAAFAYFNQTSSAVDAARSLRQMAQLNRRGQKIVNRHPYFTTNYGRKR